MARNGQRKGQERVTEEVIRRMAGRLEEPDPVRSEWEQNTLTLPTDSLSMTNAPQVVNSAIKLLKTAFEFQILHLMCFR